MKLPHETAQYKVIVTRHLIARRNYHNVIARLVRIGHLTIIIRIFTFYQMNVAIYSGGPMVVIMLGRTLRKCLELSHRHNGYTECKCYYFDLSLNLCIRSEWGSWRYLLVYLYVNQWKKGIPGLNKGINTHTQKYNYNTVG